MDLDTTALRALDFSLLYALGFMSLSFMVFLVILYVFIKHTVRLFLPEAGRKKTTFRERRAERRRAKQMRQDQEKKDKELISDGVHDFLFSAWHNGYITRDSYDAWCRRLGKLLLPDLLPTSSKMLKEEIKERREKMDKTPVKLPDAVNGKDKTVAPAPETAAEILGEHH